MWLSPRMKHSPCGAPSPHVFLLCNLMAYKCSLVWSKMKDKYTLKCSWCVWEKSVLCSWGLFPWTSAPEVCSHEPLSVAPVSWIYHVEQKDPTPRFSQQCRFICGLFCLFPKKSGEIFFICFYSLNIYSRGVLFYFHFVSEIIHHRIQCQTFTGIHKNLKYKGWGWWDSLHSVNAKFSRQPVDPPCSNCWLNASYVKLIGRLHLAATQMLGDNYT